MRNKFKINSLIAAALLSGGSLCAMAQNEADTIRVDHLGVSNTLVRVNGDAAKYLLMPVQESNDDARINVVVDGKLDRTIHVRLAKSKVDFKVPFDLTPYKGKDVVFNIVTHQNRSSVRDASTDVSWTNFELADTFDTANREKYRPMFHHTPLYGWMNDPNGMVYKDGVWHLYFQYNPYGSKWQNMTWGHSTSKDLVNWEHQPLAIEPDGLGTIFSGSSVLDPKNTAGFGEDAIVTLYTSCDVSQMQSLAHSNDNGQTFEKNPGNPILTLDTEARDPNMFWHEPTQQWVLTLAHALEHEMLIFTSPDLRNWTLQSSFGKGLGAQGGVWECPDMFELKVDGTDKTKWVLLCNINPDGPFGGSATQYFVGDFDGKTFTVDRDADGNVPTKWMDYGKDHYATVSFSDAPDNRRVVLGWMSNWQYANEVPTSQFRSANTLPRDLSLYTGTDGQIYLASAPSPEVDSLRGKLEKKAGKTAIGSAPKEYKLPTANNGICEIDASIDGASGSPVYLTLSNPAGERCTITYDPKKGTVDFDRRESGLIDFSQEFPAVTTFPMHADTDSLALRIFVDTSSIEIFGNDGKVVMTNLVFPTQPYTTLTISAQGKSQLNSLEIYSLK